jgi:hypothetical protein
MRKISILSILLSICLMSFATDWSSIAYLADGAGDGAYANKYKVAAAFGQNVINIQQPGFAAAPGIYTNFPAGIDACSLPQGKYVIEGAGMVLYLSAFTQKETPVTVMAGGVEYAFKVYYVDGEGEEGGGDEPGGDDPVGDLTPATYYGSATVEVSGSPCQFTWHITRNADATLTFDISWDADIVGAVPQICLEGTFITMPSQQKHAVLTTTQTYVDGATLSDTFFYIAYAGGAARVDITGYTVGASNEPSDTTAVETVRSTDTTRKVLKNGQVLILKNGIRYGLNGTEIK